MIDYCIVGWRRCITLLCCCFGVITHASASLNDHPTQAFQSAFQKEIQLYPQQEELDSLNRHFLAEDWNAVLAYSGTQTALQDTNHLTELVAFCRGWAFHQKALPKEALKEFTRVSPQLPLHYLVTIARGEIAAEQEEFEKALNYFSILDTLSEAQLQTVRLTRVQHNIGLCYLHLGQYEQAATQLLGNLPQVKEKQDTLMLIRTHSDLANAY